MIASFGTETMNQLARELELTQEQMLREAMRALVLSKIHTYDAERRARCAKFGVSSLEELDVLVQQGQVEEDAVLDDFQNVDFLTHRIKRLQELLGEL